MPFACFWPKHTLTISDDSSLKSPQGYSQNGSKDGGNKTVECRSLDGFDGLLPWNQSIHDASQAMLPTGSIFIVIAISCLSMQIFNFAVSQLTASIGVRIG